MSVSIFRRSREIKETALTVRLTPSDDELVKGLKEDLNFSSYSELILFGLDIVKNLKSWHKEGFHFYIGKPEERKFNEVQFEIFPMNKEAGVSVLADTVKEIVEGDGAHS